MTDLPGCSKQAPPLKRKYHVPADNEMILRKSTDLSTSDYHSLVCELIKRSPCSDEELKKEMNLARDRIGNKRARAHQSTVDAGASVSQAASKVSLICRGDLIAAKQVFFLDTEKVTEAKTHETLSGDLSIVDQDGVLVFWGYINRQNVCKYDTKLTGLTEQKLMKGIKIEEMQAILAKCFEGKEIWGAAIENDLKSLNYTTQTAPFSVSDIQDFYKDYAGKPISLAYLTEHFYGENVQGEQHSSIRDARITAICYKKMILFKKSGMERFSCPVMDKLRDDPKNNPRNKIKQQFDKCTCGKSGKKLKKKKGGKLSEVLMSTNANFNLDDWVFV